jgi:hypothetical protein
MISLFTRVSGEPGPGHILASTANASALGEILIAHDLLAMLGKQRKELAHQQRATPPPPPPARYPMPCRTPIDHKPARTDNG